MVFGLRLRQPEAESCGSACAGAVFFLLFCKWQRRDEAEYSSSLGNGQAACSEAILSLARQVLLSAALSAQVASVRLQQGLSTAK